ncbi:MAG: hypothetical protein KF878_07830 [Planctomycetes bacterium]|nr:hypothetical protein [Planctomycetota bacterium]
MTEYELLAFLAVLSAAALVVAWVGRRLDPALARLLWLALALRVVGSCLRYWVLFNVYRGVGDATGYYGNGVRIAARLRELDFSFIDPAYYWSTPFVKMVSGGVILLIGPTMLGEFLFFSLLSLVGLWCVFRAVQEAAPQGDHRMCLLALAVSPSLWFWPSSVGKEALLLLGLGLVMRGYVGTAGRVRWWSLLAGLIVAGLVRPHIAALAGLALVFAEVAPGTEWTKARIAKLAALGCAAVVLVLRAGTSFGFDPTEVEQVQAFVEVAGQRTVRGGSSIEVLSGPAALPLGLLNVLFRPFPWEARTPGLALAALELVVLWTVVWLKRGELLTTLRGWQEHRALRFALPCALLLAVAYGMTFFNLGILARQRVTVVALLLTLFAARSGPEQAPPPPRPGLRSRHDRLRSHT